MLITIKNIETFIQKRKQYIKLSIGEKNFENMGYLSKNLRFEELMAKDAWIFDVEEISFGLINMNELELLINEQVELVTHADEYRSTNCDNLKPDAWEFKLVINPIRNIQELKAEKANKLLPFHQVKYWYSFGHGDLETIGLEFVTGPKFYIVRSTFSGVGFSYLDIDLLKQECMTYIMHPVLYNLYCNRQKIPDKLKLKNDKQFVIRCSFNNINEYEKWRKEEDEDRAYNDWLNYDDIDFVRDVLGGDPDNYWNID